MNHMRQLRTYGALNSGLLTGLLGFNGFSGMIVYFVIFFVISFILLCKIKYNAKEYFFNYSDVVYSGLFGDLMVFIVVWVIS